MVRSLGPSIDPVADVVGVGPVRRDGAAGEGATPISMPKCDELGCGGEADGPSLVEGLAAAAEHDGDDRGVAGQSPDRFRRQQLPGGGGAQGGGGADAGGEVRQAHGE